MSIPIGDVRVPDAVRRLAGGARLTPLWRNELGGLTFRTDDGRVVKWSPGDPEWSAAAEAERLHWAAPFTPVPAVVDHGDGWLVTRALRGETAVSGRWKRHPEIAVRAVGEGLRAFHDALPVDGCPYSWHVDDRIAAAAGRGIRVPETLREAPPIDRLVVCTGDPCCPNTLLDDEGRWSAHVDLGGLGVADRWADLAVAAMSTEWNYGPGWHDLLLDAYGIPPDRERIAYYRELWNAT